MVDRVKQVAQHFPVTDYAPILKSEFEQITQNTGQMDTKVKVKEL
jgi:hypothetical protein